MFSSHLHYIPVSWTVYVLLLIALAILSALVQAGSMRYVYFRLGISPAAAMGLLFGSLFGSYVNIPIAHLPDEVVTIAQRVNFLGLEYTVPTEVDWPGTVIAINLGGAVIPIVLSIYLLGRNRVWFPGLIATVVVGAICFELAKPVPGAGIVIPIFIPPLAACLASFIVAWERPVAVPALAYVSGSLGTLIGADLLNLANIRGLGASVASIGGAGTFDGIFLTGLFAVVLASLDGRRRRTEDGAGFRSLGSSNSYRGRINLRHNRRLGLL